MVYVALERLLFVKVAAVVILMALAIWLAIEPASWRALPSGFSSAARIPSELGFALLMGAAAFAGAAALDQRGEDGGKRVHAGRDVGFGQVRADDQERHLGRELIANGRRLTRVAFRDISADE